MQPTTTQRVQAAFPRRLAHLFLPKRYKVAYGGRAGAKSWSFARALLIEGAKEPLRILCAREFQNSISESVHKVLSDQIDRLQFDGQASRPFYVVEKARIYNPVTGTEFYFEGIRNNVTRIKSYEGVDRCWVEEANKVTKYSWEVLIPTIRKAGSEIWVSFNPELETDETFKRFVVATKAAPAARAIADKFGAYGLETDDTVMMKVGWRDNPWLEDVVLQEMIKLKATDQDAWLNIWEGECRTVMDGAVYATELRDTAKDKRITRVPYERGVPVDVFLDLGYADATSMWFGQAVGFEYRLIDFYENQLKALEHYLKVLQDRGYVYGNIWLPHDAKAKTIGSGRSVEEQFRAKGYTVRIVPSLSLTDGITAARTVFPNCYFDEVKCADGIQALRHYRYEVREDGLAPKPLHDQYSHAADAFRYCAIALRQPRKSGLDAVVAGAGEALRRAFGTTPSNNDPQSWMGM